jgi:hypothetical protein
MLQHFQVLIEDLTFKELDEYKSSLSGSNTPVLQNSIWGQISMKIFRKNDITDRKYLHALNCFFLNYAKVIH